MNPTLEQLEAWMTSHSIGGNCDQDQAEMIAYGPCGKNGNPVIARVVITQAVSSERETLDRLELACNAIARELCIVPPRIALAMNPQHN